MSKDCAKARAESGEREATAARRQRLEVRTPAQNWRAMLPVPRMPQESAVGIGEL